MDKPTILIVDDEEDFCQTVSDILVHSGYNTIVKQNPVEALELMHVQQVDLVLLDIMLPGLSGFEVCRQLRDKGVQVPVIMLTARGDAMDRIVGLELGADDYLPKPFEPRELLARLRGEQIDIVEIHEAA